MSRHAKSGGSKANQSNANPATIKKLREVEKQLIRKQEDKEKEIELELRNIIINGSRDRQGNFNIYLVSNVPAQK